MVAPEFVWQRDMCKWYIKDALDILGIVHGVEESSDRATEGR
jgi:hypothetical protein